MKRIRQLLLTLLVLLFPVAASGEDYVGKAYNYTVQLEGTSQVSLKLPVYDQEGSDSWVLEGNVYYAVEGNSTKTTLVKWWSRDKDKDIDGNQTWVMPYMRTDAGGTVMLIRTMYDNYNSSDNVRIYSREDYWTVRREPGKERMIMHVTWTVPRELRGKRLTFSWDVLRTGNGDIPRGKVDIEPTTISIPQAPEELDPMVMQPVLAFHSAHAGQVMIPWVIGTDKVQKAQMVYQDKTTGQNVSTSMDPASSGMAYVPADHKIDNFYVQVDYKDSEGTTIYNRKSEPAISIPMLHTAKGLAAKILPNGHAQLDWHIDDPEWGDIMDGDQWEIQRNLTGSNDHNDSHWESIGMEPFDKGTANYQFVDEMLMAGYQNKAVSYRVRRISTADWGWSTSVGIALVTINYTMGLPTVTEATVVKAADWGIDSRHNVELTWKLKTSSTSNNPQIYVWDSNAKLVLYIDKYVDGKLRYTESRELTDEQRQAGKATIDLHTSCVDYRFRLAVERNGSPVFIDGRGEQTQSVELAVNDKGGNWKSGESPFYFHNNVEMGEVTFESQQTSVLLKWDTKSGFPDYFRILRHDRMENDTIVLADEYLQQVFLDEKVRPQHDYDYIVEGVTSCEGTHVSRASVVGYCIRTGLVRGYVRLIDGTALAHRQVTATPIASSGTNGAEAKTVYTDDNGFFEIDGLQYVMEGSYSVTVAAAGDEDPFTPQTVTFDDETNMVVNVVFGQANYYRFSGVVLYEGSSIPVVGAHFLRDGQPVRNASGQDVITNAQGQFSISVPKGQHTIQVVKDGHVFLNDGFHQDADGQRNLNWQKNVSGIYLWDKTKVQLRGRVVGGHIQGDKPLGQSLSKNNLGKSLTLVFQLEGDNTSWIVRDQLDPTVTERHETFSHGATDPKTGEKKDLTTMDSYRHRIIVYPDSLTGEYEVPFYPVKYKVTEIYAANYPTLFQPGTVGETLDLTAAKNGDVMEYNRIYHSVPTLRCQQMNMLGEEYYGIKQYTAMDNAGQKAVVNLWTKENGYAMGYPVYMGKSGVMMSFSAREEYYYNNDPNTEPDVVPIKGGQVLIQNGLESPEGTHTLQLDSAGHAFYTFTPDNTTFMQTGDQALRSLSTTLLYDGTYFNQEPLKAYVMAANPKTNGRRAVAKGGTYLLDILRDPPGASSSAYIENGSRLNYSFSCDWSASAGLNMELTNGSGANYYIGAWGGVGAGATSGNVNTTSSTVLGKLSLVVKYNNTWKYNYEFTTTERIQTSASTKDIGADADVYIGMTQSAILEDAVAVRVVPASMFKYLVPREGNKTFDINNHTYQLKSGTVKLLARGYDPVAGDSVFLITDEVLSLSNELSSTFVHSQAYILGELIPSLFQQRNDLMLPLGTDAAYAQSVADAQGKAVYVSKVSEDDDTYATTGSDGKPTYVAYYPKDYSDKTDQVAALNQEILTWAGFIEKNEKEKFEAKDLVKRYDFDGRASIQYSEKFSASTAESRYLKLPFIGGVSGAIQGFSALSKVIASSKTSAQQSYENDNNGYIGVDVDIFGYKLQLKFSIVLGVDYNYNYGKDESHTKTAGFTLSASRASNYVVDVYRTPSDYDRLKKLSENELKQKVENGEICIFSLTEAELRDAVDNGRMNEANATTSWLTYFKSSTPSFRNFVYRTISGVTAQPYEDQRVTKFYQPGTVLDAKTISVNNLRVWTDNALVSNVPYGDPARFNLYFTNESLHPDLAAPYFTYYLDNKSNPKGAKVFIDGNPMNESGYILMMKPGETIVKKVEVYAGADFDYDDLIVSIYDTNDPKRVYSQSLSAHFVPSAGKVNISLPGNKWVVNTESEWDDDRQDYFLPVQIDGFDVNVRNFDHIELQYKLSTQGDKNWVNVCSYYKDESLMAQASGTRKLIKDEGIIGASFYGEISPIEQTYDLRAVVYCRYGNGYLTSSSEVLTGIKDTRRPQPFGTPTPANGILGIGDDIMLRFSEQIAGNYLSEVNNFEVLGTMNSSNIALSTALRFNGYSFASTMATRNLSGKDFTIDLMLDPDNNGKAMNFFRHAGAEEGFHLGLTADRKLKVEMGDTVLVSEKAIPFNGMRQVAVVFDADAENEKTDITFYDGSTSIGTAQYDGLYQATGALFFGCGSVGSEDGNYEGSMLEARLWNRALNPAQLSSYAQKELTGYELGLWDNYPMNEGTGEYCYDKGVGSSDLVLMGTTWQVPDGMAMKLDGEEGFRLDPKFFQCQNYQDYTMMFWFRTNDEKGTLFANGMATDEANYREHFRFHLDKGTLKLNLGGKQLNSGTFVGDGNWHHAALTVNRSRNVGNLYVDKVLCQTFAVDTLGGISGNRLAAGAVYGDGSVVEDAISGHIDEIAMYEMVLPENMLLNYMNTQPTGEEMGMMAYLSFGRNELQMDNSQRIMPTGISLRRYRDPNTGKLIETRYDTIVDKSVVERLADREVFAPMRNAHKLENIPYKFVADGKDLFINLNVPDKDIEKTNVYLTVKEVADLQGNLMASPVCMDLYVYRSPLRWNQKRVTMEVDYGYEHAFEVTVKNLSGKRQEYRIEGLPLWLTASQTSGTLAALDEETIKLTMSPYTNIGDYDEVLYLVGVDEMSEPLPLTIHVRGEAPEWAVSDELLGKGIAMHVVARVEVDGQVAHDTSDRLAVFGDNHQLLGVASIDVDNAGNANDGLAYLTIYNMRNVATPLHFEFYDASTGHITVMQPATGMLTFKANSIVGTAADPLRLVNSGEAVQTLRLQRGWNWISFNVQPETATVSYLLNNATSWQPGDGLEVIGSNGVPTLITYKEAGDGTCAWDKGETPITLDPHLMYRFYSAGNKTGYLMGRTSVLALLTVKQGWNRIGFISNINLPVATALNDYTDNASAGDIIKSQSEFAMLSVDAGGNKVWKGTLKYLRVGEGYMLKRNASTSASFLYPKYLSGGRYATTTTNVKARGMANCSGTSMTMVAVADGVQVEQGDVLTAWRGAEKVGVAEADEDGLFWLSIGDAEMAASKALSFTLAHGDDVVATSAGQFSYTVNAALGTTDEPTAIRFVGAEQFDRDGWYTLGGVKLSERPTTAGVYIYNNEKVIVK